MYTARLVNSPEQDPALLLELKGLPVSYLFDCGTLHNLSTRDLLKINRVFVTHTHIDHFCGFDHLIRMQLFSPQPLHVYGPPGLAAQVGARLAGYSWNLVSSSQYSVHAHEIGGTSTEFPCRTGFAPRPGLPSTLEDGLQLTHAEVEHGVPTLAFALRWPARTHIDRQALQDCGVPAGPWLEELKRGHGDPELRARLVTATPGASLAYITDTLCSDAVLESAIRLAAGVEELWCEAAYLHEHADKARDNLHMTARQAARIAQKAGVKRLHLFHQSRRYHGDIEKHLAEAREVFPETYPPPRYKQEDGPLLPSPVSYPPS